MTAGDLGFEVVRSIGQAVEDWQRLTVGVFREQVPALEWLEAIRKTPLGA